MVTRISHLIPVLSCIVAGTLPHGVLAAISPGRAAILAGLETKYQGTKNPPGFALTVQPAGIVVAPVGSNGAIDNKVVDGRLQPQGKWDKLTTWTPTRYLDPGEKVYIYKTESKNEQLRMTLVTFNAYNAYEGYEPIQYMGVLSFRFPTKDYLDRAVLEDIDRLIYAFLVPDAPAAQNAQPQPAPVTQQWPAPATQPENQPAPVTIALGQTIDQVTAALGSPEQIADLGPKKIYRYKNLKVTFMNGKVSDVD